MPKLTLAERWIIFNQLQIIELLSPSKEKKNHGQTVQQEALINGYESFYGCPIDDETLDSETSSRVHNILGMFTVLRASYGKLADKSGLSAESVEFEGFDGNNESDEHGFANFLCRAGRYEGVLKEDNNSHGPTIARYEAMLTRYREVRESVTPLEPLTKEQILAIVGK